MAMSLLYNNAPIMSASSRQSMVALTLYEHPVVIYLVQVGLQCCTNHGSQCTACSNLVSLWRLCGDYIRGACGGTLVSDDRSLKSKKLNCLLTQPTLHAVYLFINQSNYLNLYFVSDSLPLVVSHCLHLRGGLAVCCSPQYSIGCNVLFL